MDGESWYQPASGETKKFSQWDVDTTKAGGFAAAHDNAQREIDLNVQLVRNKPATFFLRVSGDAMVNAGIFSGDILIVDRSLKAASGKIVVAVLNGEMLVRRLEKTFNRVRLIPETDRLSPIEVDPSSCEFTVWGIVTYTIHSF
jgi:DNA polymerase V